MIKTLLLITLLLGALCQIPPTPPPSFPTISTPVPTTNPTPTTFTPTPQSNFASSASPTPPSSAAAQFDTSES